MGRPKRKSSDIAPIEVIMKIREPTENGEYYVDKVTDKWIGPNGEVLYFVQWLGFPKSDNTWEPLESFSTNMSIIDDFERKRKKKEAKRKRKHDMTHVITWLEKSSNVEKPAKNEDEISEDGPNASDFDEGIGLSFEHPEEKKIGVTDGHQEGPCAPEPKSDQKPKMEQALAELTMMDDELSNSPVKSSTISPLSLAVVPIKSRTEFIRILHPDIVIGRGDHPPFFYGACVVRDVLHYLVKWNVDKTLSAICSEITKVIYANELKIFLLQAYNMFATSDQTMLDDYGPEEEGLGSVVAQHFIYRHDTNYVLEYVKK